MAEEPMPIFQETSIPYINANAFLEASFHSFELVSMIHNTFGASIQLAHSSSDGHKGNAQV